MDPDSDKSGTKKEEENEVVTFDNFGSWVSDQRSKNRKRK